MARAKRLLTGGSTGNKQLTAVVAAVLLLLLAIEGATLLQLHSLLTVHAFVGMLLIPVVALKLASTSWRMARYYLGTEEYVRLGPPPIVLRAVVAPVLILSTIVLFGTGLVLLAFGQTAGVIVGLHKASFLVWFGAASAHVLAHVWTLPQVLRLRTAGSAARLALIGGAVAAGVLLAITTLPQADHLQDQWTAHVHLDAS